MTELVADCPRCGADRITLDVLEAVPVYKMYGWQTTYEAFCLCRNCHRSTVFIVAEKTLQLSEHIGRQGGLTSVRNSANNYVDIEGYISQANQAGRAAPEHLPDDIQEIFDEAARCFTVDCFNAVGTMVRLCLDKATRRLLPAEDRDGLNARTRRDLGLRLPWLIDHGLVPEALRELSHCIREDGNDGAHAGNLQRGDAEDMLDFANVLLERLFTEPKRIELAQQRRDARRQPPQG